MDAIVQAQELTRCFGPVAAVDHVDFEVERGEIFGFLGPNGAGKTTTVRMLTGVIEPTAGRTIVRGHDLAREPTRARQGCGVVPEEANVYLDLTVWQNVMLMAELHGVPRRRRIREGERLLELFGLGERRRDKARRLSKGLRQRLMLCTALVSGPELLFLDEPTSGLDVASVRVIHGILRDLNRDGLTVFLTTHDMHEAEELCSRVAIINEGRIAAVDKPDALRRAIRSRQCVEVSFAGADGPDPRMLEALEGVSACSCSGRAYTLYAEAPGSVACRVVRLAGERGWTVEAICTRQPSLADVFLHFTDGLPERRHEGGPHASS